jgi:predicted transcriptional regulator of viral defense system
MKWEEFIKVVGQLPIIDTEILLAGVSRPEPMKVQISRWEKSGKLIQIKRGIYLLAEHYRKIDIYEPFLAVYLKKPSYISMEKAFEYHGLIPEAVPVYTLVTTKRLEKIASKAGTFDYRHIKPSLFWGYNSVTVNRQVTFMALPEKALLDYFYLTGVKVSLDYLDEMRLQNVQKINLEKLFEYAKKFNKPGILKTANVLKKYIDSYRDETKKL